MLALQGALELVYQRAAFAQLALLLRQQGQPDSRRQPASIRAHRACITPAATAIRGGSSSRLKLAAVRGNNKRRRPIEPQGEGIGGKEFLAQL